MSILIKGMEMPASCGACRFCAGIADTVCGPCAWCDVDGKARVADTRQDCPLVPVPPHGDLIDIGAVDLHDGPYEYDDWVEWALEKFLDAPTIIQASEEGER